MAFKPRYIPPWLDRIRFIAKMELSGCSIPYGVFAENALPAAKEVTMVLLTFGVGDYVKELFRPKGMRSRRHGRKGSKSTGRRGGIPDPADIAAGRNEAKEFFGDRKYGMGTRVFYAATDVLDRLAWTAFLFEGLGEIVYDGMVGAIENNPDLCPQIRRLWRRGGYHVEGAPLGAWHVFQTGTLQYNVGLSSPNEPLVFFPEGRFSVTVACKATTFQPAGTSVQMRIRDTDTLEVYDETDLVFIPFQGTNDLIVNAQVEGPCGISIQARETAGFFDSIVSDMMVMEII